ncbi:hypothetical protein [Sphaerisporangium rhizosphaerae]|uniref:DUF4232 domain-containing protein n=1 Tax=Sphaerisporangium rhizosphaerae TaxID=2269375 RepID=A0ABW2P391_9ACTN
MRQRGITHLRCNASNILAAIVLATTGCAASTTPPNRSCDEVAVGNGSSAGGIGISGKFDLTMALAIVDPPDGGGTPEIEWKPVYSIANLTKNRICIVDISTTFPTNRDKAGALLALKTARGTRQVDIYQNNAAVLSRTPSVTQRPPFALEPGATVLVRFHQYLTLTADGRDVPLRTDEDLSERLGPLFRLNRLDDGSYHCVPQYPLKVTVTSDIGTSTQEVINAIMPDGCGLILPTG